MLSANMSSGSNSNVNYNLFSKKSPILPNQLWIELLQPNHARKK